MPRVTPLGWSGRWQMQDQRPRSHQQPLQANQGILHQHQHGQDKQKMQAHEQPADDDIEKNVLV